VSGTREAPEHPKLKIGLQPGFESLEVECGHLWVKCANIDIMLIVKRDSVRCHMFEAQEKEEMYGDPLGSCEVFFDDVGSEE
jgi:hypothetical protein